MIVLKFSYIDVTQGLRTWDDEQSFENMKEAKAYLKENFPHKRQFVIVRIIASLTVEYVGHINISSVIIIAGQRFGWPVFICKNTHK